MHYDFCCNGELKQELKNRKITYADLANQMFYSVASVKHWLSRPLTADMESKIKQAVKEIIKERGEKEYAIGL